jgi:hypothetical protein
MLSKWLERLRGGSGSAASETTAPVTAPEPASMPEEAPPMPAETDAGGDEASEPAGGEPA